MSRNVNLFSRVSNSWLKILAAVLFVATISSCNSCNSDRPDISKIDVKLNWLRLEQDVTGLNKNYDSTYQILNERYADFLPFFLKMVVHLVPPSDTAISRDTFLHYINDPYITALRDTAKIKFKDLSDVQQDLTKAFQYFRYYYRDVPLPNVVTFVDGPPYGFTYDVNYLAIGLDGYFGEESLFYTAMAEPIPAYILRKLRPEYIVPNSMNVWLSGLYDFDMNGHKLIDAMVFKGKVYYAMKKILPDTQDSLIFGYPDSTVTWLAQNENEVWRFFIKNNLLYNTDPMVFSKFVNDAPNTSGMPAEAPGNIGSWVGYRIVEKYMERNKNITLPQLMAEQDAQKILTESRYKP